MAQDINVNITNGVTEVNGVVPDINGVITIETGDIPESVNANFVSDAQLTVIGNTSGTNTGDQDLSGLVVKNANITGATKTKITYDAKGLVTSGADATTADIADSTNKRYVTDANLTVIGNTSGTNTGNQSLQGVTTVGAITADNITVQALNKQSGLNNSEIYSTDLITGARCSMNANGSMGLKNATTFEVLFKATNATANYNLEAPIKSAGTYTLALTSDLTSLAPLTTSTTGSVISFATPQVYNTFSAPSTANLTDDLTGAKIGYVQKIYHNKAVAPTVPAGWVLIGTGTYTTSTLNIIFAEWVSGTRVEYWITKPA
jgi:hypothetical protein